MKHFTLLSTLLLSSMTLPMMAYDVTTEVQKKNVLIEEFTGIHCGYCPQAHIIAHNLEGLNPGRIFTISVHAGSYAVPGSDQPDYQTEDGNTLDAGLGTTTAGRPCGVLNRRTYSNDNGNESMIYSRSIWGKTAKQITSEDTPVNLLIKADCDASTRILNVTVEGYCTGVMPSDKAFLTIAMTQDDVMGPQNGAGLGDEYIHQSMLRDFLTPVWGDEVAVAQGEYFSKEYTFELPTEIVGPDTGRGIDLELEDINLVAFLTEDGKNNVMNVTSVKPSFTNLNVPLSAELSHTVMGMSKKYGFNYFEVVLKNRSNVALTSADFIVTLNDDEQEQTWTGEIPPLGKQVIRVPYDRGAIESSNTWSIRLYQLNGREVDGSELKGTFSKPSACESQIMISMQMDFFADEDLIRILDEDGNVVREFVYEADYPGFYNEEVSLEANKTYCFEIIDLWADGIDGGSFKIKNIGDGKMVEQNYSIPDVGYRTFFETSLLSVEGIESDELNINCSDNVVKTSQSADIRVYAMSGSQVLSVSGDEVSLNGLEAGLYIVEAATDTERIVSKVLVKY